MQRFVFIALSIALAITNIFPLGTVPQFPMVSAPLQQEATLTPSPTETPTPESTPTFDSSQPPTLEVTPTSTITQSPLITETPIPVIPSEIPTETASTAAPYDGLEINTEKDYVVYGEELILAWSLSTEAITAFGVSDALNITWQLPEGVIPLVSSDIQVLESSVDTDMKYQVSSMLSGQTNGEFTLRISEEAKTPIKIHAVLMDGNEKISDAELKLDVAEVFTLSRIGGEVSTKNNDISVSIPEGLLDEDVQIRFRPFSNNSRFSYMIGNHPVDIVVEGLNSKTEYQQFSTPIQIQIHYDETELDGDENGLTLFYYDSETQLWRPWYTEVDPVNNVMTVETDHLTPTDYDIQNWQASRLPTMKDFQVASFTGSATYSYPIQVPSGPAGLKPGIALTYNSQMIDNAFSRTQGSFTGMGWSLDLGSIERNMNGTDDYLADDTYSLTMNGASGTLFQVPEDVDGDPNTDDYRLENNNFWRIRHFRMPYITADSYLSDQSYWKIWDLSGNEYQFGGPVDTTNQTTIDNTITNARALFPWDKNCSEHIRKTWAWMLYQVRDPNGNHLLFQYYADEKSNIASCGYIIAFSKAIYPDNILYFANGSNTPSYRISFTRESRYDYDGVWTDRASRKFFGQYRLKDIQIEASTTETGVFDKIIRKYVLTYASNGDTANIIFPNITWHNDYGDFRNSTLIKIEEYGENGAGPLPATTFRYDSMHLIEANNGYGGKVNFTYEPWAESQGDQFYSAGSGEGLPIGWQASVVNVGTWNTYFRPGQAYYVKFTAQTWAPDEVKLGFNWNLGVQYSDQITTTLLPTGDHEYLFEGWVYIPANTPTGVDLHFVFECAANHPNNGLYACYPHSYTIWSVLTRYRVETKTLSDTAITPNTVYVHEYTYGGAASNNTTISTAAATTDPYIKPYQEFRGHEWVRETAPDNSTTTTYFYQDDDRKGQAQKSEVRDSGGVLLSTVENSYGIFDNWTLINTPTKENGPAYTGFKVRWVYPDTMDQRIYNPTGNYIGTRQKFDYFLADQGGTQFGLLTQTIESSCSYQSGGCTPYRLMKTIYSPSLNSTSSYFVQRPVETASYSCPSGTCALTNQNLLKKILLLYTIPGKPYLLSGLKTLLRFDDTSLTNPRYQDTAFEYDNWGNQNKIIQYTVDTAEGIFGGDPQFAQATVTCFGEFGGTTESPTCENDVYHTYPSWQVNALGHLTRWIYNKALGLMTQTIDPNGATSSFSYDLYGRVVNVVFPYDFANSPSVQISYHDAVPFWTEFRQKIDTNTSAVLQKYYNGLGQLLQTRVIGAVVNGTAKDIIVDYAYDSMGRAWKQSVPRDVATGGGMAAQNFGTVVQTSYDALGRPLVVTQPDGTITGYAYTLSGNTLVTTITDATGNATTQKTDAFGRVLSVLPADYPDNPGVSYTYDALDRLKTATYGSAVTTITYDWAGRKTSMTDPDMGEWTYQYDGLGNLVAQTDAEDQTIWMEYDSLNRLLEKWTYTEDVPPVAITLSTYSYDAYCYPTDLEPCSPVNMGIGRRTSMADASGSTAWMYDERGRLSTETKNLTGAGTFLTQWTYYANDAVKEMTYPGGNNGQAGEVVTYDYNSQALLKSMHSPEMNYVPEIIYDAAGRVDEMTLGEGLNNGVLSPILERDYSYYAWNMQSGRMQSSSVQSLISNINLQALTYTYDPNGNITHMIDARQSGSETSNYQYDSLNRLRTVNGAYSEFVTYDGDGRIADRTMPDETVSVIWDDFQTKDLTNWTWSTYTTVPYEHENDEVVKSTGNTDVYTTGFSRNAAIDPETTINLRFKLSQTGSNARFYFGLSPVECGGGEIMSLGEDASGAFPEVILPTFAPPPPLMCYYDQAGVVERSGKLYFFIQSAGTLETETRTLLLNGAQANTWYQLSLHRGTGSASSPLTITVTKESDPSTTGTVTQTVSWVDWHFRHTIRSGTAYIDDYSERGETVEYAYGGQPHAVTSITSGGQTIRQYTYDLNGNMTQRIEGSDTYTFTYDTENRLMSGAKNGVTLASYTYDGDGKRVKAQEGGFTTYYIGDYYEWREGPTTTAVKYYYAAGQRIAMRQGGVLTWLLGDHLGSTTITANENGTLATEQTYTAWGQTRSGSVTTDRQYTGQISEPQLGIYFYNARYYDPYSARFLSADSIIPDPYNPVDWDRYAYVRNDPINGLDPSGNMRTESDGCFFAECGYTGPDYFPGGSTKQEKALKLINHLIEDQQEGGPQYSWTGLHEQHRKIFEEAGWNEAIYNDSVQPALSKADAAHDPAFYIVTAFTLGKLGAKVITAISSYFCLDSNCNNEIEWIDGVFPKTQAQISHIFRNAYGHLANDTAANRDLFLRAISPDNFIKVDQYGNQIFAQIIADGTEVWVIVRNGIIQNAGVNQIPQWIK